MTWCKKIIHLNILYSGAPRTSVNICVLICEYRKKAHFGFCLLYLPLAGFALREEIRVRLKSSSRTLVNTVPPTIILRKAGLIRVFVLTTHQQSEKVYASDLVNNRRAEEKGFLRFRISIDDKEEAARKLNLPLQRDEQKRNCNLQSIILRKRKRSHHENRYSCTRNGSASCAKSWRQRWRNMLPLKFFTGLVSVQYSYSGGYAIYGEMQSLTPAKTGAIS